MRCSTTSLLLASLAFTAIEVHAVHPDSAFRILALGKSPSGLLPLSGFVVHANQYFAAENLAADGPSHNGLSTHPIEQLPIGYPAEYKALKDDVLHSESVPEGSVVPRAVPYIAQLSNGHLIGFMDHPIDGVEDATLATCDNCDTTQLVAPQDPVNLRKRLNDMLPRDEGYVPVVQIADGQINFHPNHPPVPAMPEAPPAVIETSPEVPGGVIPGEPAGVPEPPAAVVRLQSTTCIWEYPLTTVTTVLTQTTSTCFTIDLRKRATEPTHYVANPSSPAGRTTSAPQVDTEDDALLRRQALIKGSGSRVRVLGLIWLGVCVMLGAAVFVIA
jgi:hypothetical protein